MMPTLLLFIPEMNLRGMRLTLKGSESNFGDRKMDDDFTSKQLLNSKRKKGLLKIKLEQSTCNKNMKKKWTYRLFVPNNSYMPKLMSYPLDILIIVQKLRF